MPVAEPLTCPCPPAGVIDVVGKKWALCVVSLLGRYGALRFGAIQRTLTSVSPATLTATLRSLEERRLVSRTPIVGDRRATEAYILSPRGRALNRSLLPLAGWLREAER